jgi:hypothetical protein
MIDNPQVGQEVVIWSSIFGQLAKATIAGLRDDGRVTVELVTSSGAIYFPKHRQDVYTFDDALPLLLMEAAGQYPGGENERARPVP